MTFFLFTSVSYYWQDSGEEDPRPKRAKKLKEAPKVVKDEKEEGKAEWKPSPVMAELDPERVALLVRRSPLAVPQVEDIPCFA